LTLPILYQDKEVVVINKPHGLLTHKSKIARNASSNAMEEIRDQIGQWVYPIHRLDRPTSGLLVFALSSEIAKYMHTSLAEGAWHKMYHAVVRGYAIPYKFIDHPLRKRYDRISDGKIQNSDLIQSAQTHIHTLAQVELPIPVGAYATTRYSLVRAIPLTGRRHQIRRHLAHMTHPIIGDTTHGRTEHNHFFKQHFQSHRLLLAATHISFPHPIKDQQIDLYAPLTESFAYVCQQLFPHANVNQPRDIMQEKVR
jgi:tRNA pseudouridine65 synthase